MTAQHNAWRYDAFKVHRHFSQANPSIGMGAPTEVFFLALALGGEVGELQNVIKKAWRGDRTIEAAKADIASEIADIRIYLEHLCTALEIDIDEACAAKMATNKLRWPEAFKPLPQQHPRRSKRWISRRSTATSLTPTALSKRRAKDG